MGIDGSGTGRASPTGHAHDRVRRCGNRQEPVSQGVDALSHLHRSLLLAARSDLAHQLCCILGYSWGSSLVIRSSFGMAPWYHPHLREQLPFAKALDEFMLRLTALALWPRLGGTSVASTRGRS